MCINKNLGSNVITQISDILDRCLKVCPVLKPDHVVKFHREQENNVEELLIDLSLLSLQRSWFFVY